MKKCASFPRLNDKAKGERAEVWKKLPKQQSPLPSTDSSATSSARASAVELVGFLALSGVGRVWNSRDGDSEKIFWQARHIPGIDVRGEGFGRSVKMPPKENQSRTADVWVQSIVGSVFRSLFRRSRNLRVRCWRFSPREICFGHPAPASANGLSLVSGSPLQERQEALGCSDQT